MHEMAQAGCNRAQLAFRLIKREEPRITPYRLRVVRGEGYHASRCCEGGYWREVAFYLRWQAVGEVAEALEQVALGSTIVAEGFWAGERLAGRGLELHVQRFCIAEGACDEQKVAAS